MAFIRRFIENIAADIAAQGLLKYLTGTYVVIGVMATWEWLQGRSPLEILLLTAALVFAGFALFDFWAKRRKSAQAKKKTTSAKFSWKIVIPAVVALVLVVAVSLLPADLSSNDNSIKAGAGGEKELRYYVRAEADSLASIQDKILLVFTNHTGRPMRDVVLFVSPAVANQQKKHPQYYEVMKQAIPPQTYSQGQTGLRVSVPVGHYLANIHTEDGVFIESLRIEAFENRLVEIVTVWRDDPREIVYQNDPPTWFWR